MKNRQHRTLFLLSALGIALLALSAAVADVPNQLPDPDGKPGDQSKPVQVFILMGQSNMLGFGRVHPEDKPGTLTYLTRKEDRYPHLIDDEGNWTVRNDVQYVQTTVGNRQHPLTVKGNHIGVELQFGHIMGHIHDEPVLILKACTGNRSLGWDLLPPGSEQFTYEGRTYAGYEDTPSSWIEGEPKKAVNWYAGKQYDTDTTNAKEVLKNLARYCPDYRGQGYEVAGFVWWQGHKDQNPAHASRYEQNLVHLIKTLREEFDAPNARFVLATIGFGGWDLKGPGLTVANAQLAVSGETGKYPEFKDNAKTVEARGFWRDKNVSPSGAGYHYNHNAETYMEVGNALGWAMADLLGKEMVGQKKPVEMLQDDFLKLRFGMFVHFNMATYKGVQWVSGYPDPSTFNPGVEAVNTDAWADAAVSAGMRYGILTAKHVSGFCLWDSEFTTYDVMHPDCPYRKDLVAQFIESFKSRGLKVGLYYCWRHPRFGDPSKFKVLPPECDPATHTSEQQNEFQKAQIAELLTKYPDVFYIWNDALDPEVMAADKISAHLRGVRPQILASANWWNWAKKGTPYMDIAVKEMRQFPEGNRAPGETCWCVEQEWFWNEGTRSKTAKQVIDLMNTANSRNSNFLLNVGPDRNGNIIESSIKTLAEIGQLWNPNATADSLR